MMETTVTIIAIEVFKSLMISRLCITIGTRSLFPSDHAIVVHYAELENLFSDFRN